MSAHRAADAAAAGATGQGVAAGREVKLCIARKAYRGSRGWRGVVFLAWPSCCPLPSLFLMIPK
eukprot:scaffold39662_cov49-Phaeocystis_antarctica.AAC.3